MKTVTITKGLDIPIAGGPEQTIRPGNPIHQVALIGDDYVGMKPTMLVAEGDRVALGQRLFTDKKNPGVVFTAPGCGRVAAINRGERRRFESLVIELDGEEAVVFGEPTDRPEDLAPARLRELLVESGLWTGLRTRPYGKTPAIDAEPSSLFVTAVDSRPLAGDPQVVIAAAEGALHLGLKALRRLVSCPIHYCTGARPLLPGEEVDGIDHWSFTGPHPAGLPSTHIHFLDPVHERKTVWQIGYQDVIAFGRLLATGRLPTERVVALAGTGVLQPSLVTTRLGASLVELCRRELSLDELRVVSGSVLSGRRSAGPVAFLGRFHDQVSVLRESSGRSLFNWLLPGRHRFSILPVFLSAYCRPRLLPMNTALWGGRRAIFPLGTYEKVMPLDIIATSLLKALSVGDTEKSKALGALELIEEDLGLCGYVCPGKNEFGQALRQVLTAIESGG